MAGAYITPLLDLLETLIQQNENMAAQVTAMAQSRATGLEAMRNVIAKGEAMGAFPDWMLGELKRIAGDDANG